MLWCHFNTVMPGPAGLPSDAKALHHSGGLCARLAGRQEQQNTSFQEQRLTSLAWQQGPLSQPLGLFKVHVECSCLGPSVCLQDWTSCKGSLPDSRGYTCGLWMLLHSLAARLPEEGNSGVLWLTSVKGFIKSFFQCRWGTYMEAGRRFSAGWLGLGQAAGQLAWRLRWLRVAATLGLFGQGNAWVLVVGRLKTAGWVGGRECLRQLGLVWLQPLAYPDLCSLWLRGRRCKMEAMQ